MIGTVGLRERKKTQKAHSLAETALRMFCEQGFDETTVEEIALACDVSPRTFFRYFPAKEDVLFGGTDERLTALVDAVIARPEGESPLQSLRGAFLDVGFDSQLKERILRRNRVMEVNPRLRRRLVENQIAWEDALVEALRTRIGAPHAESFDLLLVVGAATTAVRMAIRVWVDGGGSSDLIELVVAGFEQFESGF